MGWGGVGWGGVRVAIRLSLCAFFKRKLVGGGTSIPDWRVVEVQAVLVLKM